MLSVSNSKSITHIAFLEGGFDSVKALTSYIKDLRELPVTQNRLVAFLGASAPSPLWKLASRGSALIWQQMR